MKKTFIAPVASFSAMQAKDVIAASGATTLGVDNTPKGGAEAGSRINEKGTTQNGVPTSADQIILN